MRAEGARALAGDFSQVMRAIASFSSDQEASRSIADAAGDGDCRNNAEASVSTAVMSTINVIEHFSDFE